MIVLHAHAKINLWLRIVAREQDTGYHQIETAFCRLRLSDELRFESLPEGFVLTVEGADLGEPADNLVTRAASAFRDETGLDPAVHVRLTKRIPAGAGLGGGSSDAATTLLALNRIHGWPLAGTALHEIACRLGADVPFFLSGAALALGWGRGDRLLGLPGPPAANVCLVCPPIPIPTADAYRALDVRHTAPPPMPLEPGVLRSWDEIAEHAHNDFESVASRWVGDFAAIRAALLDAGARLALLAGSGSAVFGVFDRSEPPRDALQALFPDAVTLVTGTIREPVPGVDPAPSHD
jgi:4-diphosphocytidyl-2-C-methyl-D-erythritol kinase